MSSPPPPPPHHHHHHHHLKKPTSFPDFIFTAFSLFILFSSSKPSINLLHKLPPPSLSFPLNPQRRFSKLPTTMSFPPHEDPTSPFSSPTSLSLWLKPRLSSESFASWGVKPGTKNVHNLWLELSEGETVLADSIPPVRTVEVVVVRVVRGDGKVLIESHQVLSDGAVRRRGRPLSEKMKPGETVEGAVYRAIREELGSVVGRVEVEGVARIVENSYFKKVEERVSVSYPGLPACYVLHTVDATVEGLPEGEFWTEEGEEYGEGVSDEAVLCKKHYWKWVDSDTIG